MAKHEYVRAIELPHAANQAKIDKIHSFARQWRSAMTCCKQDKIAYLKETGKITRFLKDQWTIGKPDFLTARLFKSVENQVNAALKSWAALAQKRSYVILKEWRAAETISHEKYVQLCAVTRQRLWWTDIIGEKLIHEVLRSCPFPVFTATSMHLDDIVCCPGSNAQGHWLRLKMLGEILDIPVTPSSYYFTRMEQGDPCAVTILKLEEGQLRIHRMVRKPIAPKRETGRDMGLDWGLSTLLTTSEGDLLGRRLLAWLKKRDDELVTLTKELQRRNIPLKTSQRYRRLNKRIRDHVNNEVRRVLNVVASWDVKSLAVERLDFRCGGLSRRLNRILNRAGRAAFRAKLESLEEEKGIAVRQVNPAYTSQQCYSCGYVDKRNRTKQETFSCYFCGRTYHADVNAARNIYQRSISFEDGLCYSSKENVLSFLDNNFTDQWSVDATVIRQRPRRKPSHAGAVRLDVR